LPTIHVDSFDSPIFVVLTPIVTVISVVYLMRRWRKQSEEAEEEYDIEKIPELLGGVFNAQQQNCMQQNPESNILETDNIQCKNAYIC